LDPSSEGLLLLTTHGHLKAQLENAMQFFNNTIRVRVFQVFHYTAQSLASFIKQKE
jgi:16S rRNA U516 pseudouridylate synthase RsuA-like enzyme